MYEVQSEWAVFVKVLLPSLSAERKQEDSEVFPHHQGGSNRGSPENKLLPKI